MQNADSPANAKRLLWAGFTAILAAGAGFALRNGMLGAWAEEFKFTGTQLGVIGGAGFSGFCFGIIIGGLVVDKLGYGRLVVLALLGHIVSAVVALAATDGGNAFNCLYWGAFIFAYANGTLEAVANPLVATCFPSNRTHYLNILHASWPLGMIVGAGASYLIGDGAMLGLSWRWQLAFYLVPTLAYAAMFLGQTFPRSEAAAKGASFAEMFKDVGLLGAAVAGALISIFLGNVTGHPNLGWGIGAASLLMVGVLTRFTPGSILLFVLFITHALVGSVELGTDGWIENITGNLFSKVDGKILFVWSCVIMFSLRFCAHFIESRLRLSPVGLLLVCSLLAFVGLRLASGMETFAAALVAIGIYAVGKTFFWPTMLAIVGDRFPRSGAVAMSIIGGIGMLSAGLIGGPGLGFAKDRFTAEAVQASAPAVYAANKAEAPSDFLFFDEVVAVDGAKLEAARKASSPTDEQKALVAASVQGDRATLKVDAYIPLAMAAIYLLLLFYFRGIGGYRPLRLEEQT